MRRESVKVLISITDELLKKVDEIVNSGRYRSRSEFIREAIRLLLDRERYATRLK